MYLLRGFGHVRDGEKYECELKGFDGGYYVGKGVFKFFFSLVVWWYVI